MIKKISTLITCHNRREKTLSCLDSLFKANLPEDYELSVYLVDDGSTDGTSEEVKNKYPEVNIIMGNGRLFWAGGMRLAWSEALKEDCCGYLLLNDDTILFSSALTDLINMRKYSIEYYNQEGIYVGTTFDPFTNEYTYGGRIIVNKISGRSIGVKPKNNIIQRCDFANCNILFVSKTVTDKIGILSDKFIHLLADYDYTLTASKRGIPVLVCSSYCGTCVDDHGKNWLSGNHTLNERIKYLKSPKYLAYYEHLYYIKRHFPMYLPISFIKLWARTFFPSIWDKYKKDK